MKFWWKNDSFLSRWLILIFFHSTDGQESLDESDDSYLFRNISLHLSTNLDCCAHQQWWVVKENCDDIYEKKLLSKVPLNDCRYIMMFLFNDKAFPEGLSFISGFGWEFIWFQKCRNAQRNSEEFENHLAPNNRFDEFLNFQEFNSKNDHLANYENAFVLVLVFWDSTQQR